MEKLIKILKNTKMKTLKRKNQYTRSILPTRETLIVVFSHVQYKTHTAYYKEKFINAKKYNKHEKSQLSQ